VSVRTRPDLGPWRLGGTMWRGSKEGMTTLWRLREVEIALVTSSDRP